MFILITVLLFDYPFLQFSIHEVFTLAYIFYLVRPFRFESKLRKYTEVAAELINLLAITVLQ